MIKVAIIEDNRTTREGLETLINRKPNCQCVCTCATAKEALRRVPQAQPDVILMDIHLPDISGIECTARIKELLPSVQIIILTVYADQNSIFQALQHGACGYLLKRCPPERILDAIQEVHQGGVPMTAEIARKVIGQFQDQGKTATNVESLSTREREVLELVVEGLGNKAIAERLGVTIEAVKWHLRNIYSKLHVHSRMEAAAKVRTSTPP
jgi:DNA-binding NarL/FixJ family response regulator